MSAAADILNGLPEVIGIEYGKNIIIYIPTVLIYLTKNVRFAKTLCTATVMIFVNAVLLLIR